METQGKRGRYSAEVRARAVRFVLDHAGDYGPQWEAIVSIVTKFGCTAETLRPAVGFRKTLRKKLPSSAT